MYTLLDQLLILHRRILPMSLGCALALLPALVPEVQAGPLSCAPTNILLDGGFEQASGAPPVSPDWTGSSTAFGSPLCRPDLCSGRGAAAPRSGETWALFGGVSAAGGESAVLTQAIVLPVGAQVTLELELWISDVASPFSDTLTASIDGQELEVFSEPATAESDYSLRSIVLDAWADGLAHTLELAYDGPDGGGFAAFNLDDARIVTRQGATLLDGGFEAATGDPLDSPAWDEASLEFGSPICTLAVCGDGAGSVGPLTGAAWTWFGGVAGSTPEVSSLRQVVSMPPGAYVDLKFELGVGAVTAPFTDELTVTLDGIEVASFLEPKVADTWYVPRSAIVDPYADGEPHELRFEYIKGENGNGANFSLDDVRLEIVECLAILVDGFESHDTSNWSATIAE